MKIEGAKLDATPDVLNSAAEIASLTKVRQLHMPLSWNVFLPSKEITLEEAAGPQWLGLGAYVQALRDEAEKAKTAIRTEEDPVRRAILYWTRVALLNEANTYQINGKRAIPIQSFFNYDFRIPAMDAKLKVVGTDSEEGFLTKSIESISVDLDELLNMVSSQGWLSAQEKKAFLEKLGSFGDEHPEVSLKAKLLKAGFSTDADIVKRALKGLTQKIIQIKPLFEAISEPANLGTKQEEIQAGLEVLGVSDSVESLAAQAKVSLGQIQDEIRRLTEGPEDLLDSNPSTEDAANEAIQEIKQQIAGYTFGALLHEHMPKISYTDGSGAMELASTSPDGRVVRLPKAAAEVWQNNVSRFRQTLVHELTHVLQAHLRPDLKDLSSQTGREGMAIMAEALWAQQNPTVTEQLALLRHQEKLTHKWLLALQYHSGAIDQAAIEEVFPGAGPQIASAPGFFMKYYIGQQLASIYALHGLEGSSAPDLKKMFEELAEGTGLVLLPHVLVVQDPTNISLSDLLGNSLPLCVRVTQSLTPPADATRQDTSAAVNSVLQ